MLNTCQFCWVSAMIDQLPKPAIGDQCFFCSVNLRKIWASVVWQVFVASLWGRQRLLGVTWLTCITAYHHSVTCLERTGFSNLKDAVVKFTFHTHRSCACVVSLHNVIYREIAFLCVIHVVITCKNKGEVHGEDIHVNMLSWRIWEPRDWDTQD